MDRKVKWYDEPLYLYLLVLWTLLLTLLSSGFLNPFKHYFKHNFLCGIVHVAQTRTCCPKKSFNPRMNTIFRVAYDSYEVRIVVIVFQSQFQNIVTFPLLPFSSSFWFCLVEAQTRCNFHCKFMLFALVLIFLNILRVYLFYFRVTVIRFWNVFWLLLLFVSNDSVFSFVVDVWLRVTSITYFGNSSRF